MTDRLFVGVLGHQHAGKTTTWSTLFGGANVRTGQYPRPLMLYGGECVDVFLVNGSPQERGRKAKEILQHQGCRIVLCSIQYSEAVRETLDYITEEKFDMFVQWLNPGRHDADKNSDTLGLMPWLLDHNATVSVRDGKIDAGGRTEEIRQFIHGWAKARQLVFACQSGGGCGD